MELNKKNVELIEQVELLKDILWFLKGYNKAKTEDMELSDLGKEHIEAISDIVEYIQNREIKQ